MEENETKQRIKLGAFVAGGVMLFLIAVLFIGSASNFFSRTFIISAVFKNVEGLKEGDKVWLSGVQIGTVKTVRIIHVGEVIVTVSLKEKQNEFIRKNATASIGSDGLIGNKIVVIQPGNSPAIIDDGDVINALSPADTQELITIAKEVGENTRSITRDMKTISSKIIQGKGIVGELVNDGNFSQEIRTTVSRLKAASLNTERTTSELAAIAFDIKHSQGLVHTLLTDTSYVRVFDQTLQNTRKVSADAASMSKSLESVTAKINDSHNAIGVLLADTVFAGQMKTILKNSEKASYKLDENMEALKHNFLTRGYFRKKAKQEKKEQELIEKEKLKLSSTHP